MSTKSGRMKRRMSPLRAGIVGLAVVLIAGFQAASAAPRDKVDMLDQATGQSVAGAFSMLDRGDEGVTTKVRTRTRPGHAHTLWYVIFNAPQHCSDDICGEDDIFIDPGDHNAGFNAEQIAATRASSLWGSAGAVANPAGRLELDGALEKGEVPAGSNQVVIGRGEDGALVPLGVVTGLEDPRSAVILVVLQDHGPAQGDPQLLETQLTSFMGACNPVCAEPQFAVHVP
jgi:hypothetical protein